MTELPVPNLDSAEDESHSSLSSFVPIDLVQDAIQIIDENKRFNNDILEYINAATRGEGDHRIIAVFGSQLTGKLTLLNNLFNTNFDVMDEVNRQQTTKGIWLALSPGVSNLLPRGSKHAHENLLVMDVEGTDGRERGENQDFERKAALFAMSTSEVLIVNLWETQVGLYQGANMGLLKTVFEVNLLLFGKLKLQHNDHKVLLLFVIRDHLGVTPLLLLSATVTQDLLRIWDSLNKPPEVASLAFSDFFDLAFHTLSHKVLQHDKFMHDVRMLGNRFVDASDEGFLFKPHYHHDIPIEGWTMYAANCWEQIDNNKDLDLPTQQILVAKFKCDEIAALCLDEFVAAFGSVKALAEEQIAASNVDYKDVGLTLTDLKENVLENYDLLAAKYNAAVYSQRRTLLGEKVNGLLHDVVALYANHLLAHSAKQFASGLGKKSRSAGFLDTANSLTESVTTEFAENLAYLSLRGELNTNSYAESLEKEIYNLISKQQVVELNAIVSKFLRKLNNTMSTAILEEIANPTEYTWDHILEKFNALREALLSKYRTAEGTYDFGLGAEAELNEATAKTIEFRAWELLDSLLHKYISRDSLLTILKDRFDDKFRYDENGLPRLYQNARELEVSFGEAKAHAMLAFPVLTFARLNNATELLPGVDVRNRKLKRRYDSVRPLDKGNEDDDESDADSDEDEDEQCFAQILSEQEKAEVMTKFKREIDAKFVETKRLIIQHVTQIPYYIYLVILVLGWNEFMAVLRNPLFFTLLVIIGAALYVMYQMNLLGPAYIVAQRMVDEALVVAKEKLREFVVDEHEQHGRNLKKMAPAEEIELVDLPSEDDAA